ncbi:MAG: hypothetical protein QOG16_1040 [Actinomycetota bacterium]|jgi:hypothetical protein|nr:hypothetical protein [Actinomycetota bacterium]
MHREVRWSLHTLPQRNAASSFERLPPESLERWRALLGRKISIRYALAGDPEHPFSEAIGVVSGVSEGDAPTVTILARSGATIEVRAGDVLQGKVFP